MMSVRVAHGKVCAARPSPARNGIQTRRCCHAKLGPLLPPSDTCRARVRASPFLPSRRAELSLPAALPVTPTPTPQPYRTPQHSHLQSCSTGPSSSQYHLSARHSPKCSLPRLANVAGTQEPIYGSEAIQPVTKQAAETPYTELQKDDLKWVAMESTCVETQTFYLIADNGRLGMAQVIYSNVA